MREFVRVGWHVDGVSMETYFEKMTIQDRHYIHDELTDIVAQADGPPPKQMRKGF